MYPNFNYGFFYSLTLTFLRSSPKAIESHRIAQWVFSFSCINLHSESREVLSDACFQRTYSVGKESENLLLDNWLQTAMWTERGEAMSEQCGSGLPCRRYWPAARRGR